jgi:hypothetical protein
MFLNHNVSRDGSSLVIRWTYSGGFGGSSMELASIGRNAVVEKHGDDGESPKNRSQFYNTIDKNI